MYQLMKLSAWLSMLCLALLFLLPSAAFAAEQIVEADGEYLVGTGLEESFSKARERAEADAMANAAKQMAVYVEAITEVKNHQLTASEVRTLAAKVMGQVKPSSFNNIGEGDVIRIRCHVVVRVKDDDVLAALQTNRPELKEALEQLQKVTEEREALNRENEKLIRKNEELNRQLQAAMTGTEQTKIREQQVKIQQQVKANDTSFTAVQWLERGIRELDKPTVNEVNFDAAIAYLEKAISLEPTNAEAYFNLGRAHRLINWIKPSRERDYGKAIEYFNKTLSINPSHANAYVWLGHIYSDAAVDDNNKAIKCYSKAMNLDPGNQTYARNFLCGTYDEMAVDEINKHKYDEAIRWLNKAIAINPDGSSAYYWFGMVYMRKGEYNEAIKYYSKSIALNPSDSNAYSDRGKCYEKTGQLKAAKQDYAKAYELAPRFCYEDKERSENW